MRTVLQRIIPAASTPRSVCVRHLGNAARGPPLTPYNVPAHFQNACDLFVNPSSSYSGWVQQCESLRMFVFWGVVAGVTVDLVSNPPKSSYWLRYSPRRWGPALMGMFSGGRGEGLFLEGPLPFSVDVGQLYKTEMNK
uniref:Uncharacterized protein n=1 Tax=Vitrella brassicaformis TaxID=1169539 RepID=A0A7S1PEM2_9ALVE|mmetsp:Transcript_9177/g.22495  ORF Transcript_9177/g.22495 Transcript_9177/m.22495 type:complete len:138 (+) Transcript_9177:93-506(+)